MPAKTPKHSPPEIGPCLPWKSRVSPDHMIAWRGNGATDANGAEVFFVPHVRLIVRAVNSHEALVEALRDMLEGYDNDSIAHVEQASRAARAALKLAEGE